MAKKHDGSKRYYTVKWWNEEMDNIVLKFVREHKLTDDEWAKLHTAFNELGGLLYQMEVIGRGIRPCYTAGEVIIEGIKNHALEYALLKFDPDKYSGKVMNFFVFCGKRECYRLTNKYFNADNTHISIESFKTTDEPSDDIDYYNIPPLDPSYSFDDNETHTLVHRQRKMFDDMYQYYTVVKPLKAGRRLEILERTKKTLDGEMKFIPRKDGYEGAVYLYDHLNLNMGGLSNNPDTSYAEMTLRSLVREWLKYKGVKVSWKIKRIQDFGKITKTLFQDENEY